MIDVKIVCEDEKYMPKYANNTDACMDLKAKINLSDEEQKYFTFDDGVNDSVYSDSENSIYIAPNQTRKVYTGVQVAIPEGYVMKMYVRSSTGIKNNLVLANGTGIIDAGYRDEIIMALHNTGNKPIKIKDGDRLCQFIILPYPKINLIQTQDNEDFRQGDRGGGIGSTGK